MKIFQLNHSDSNGGAARAAYRIHQALRAFSVDTTLLVNIKGSNDWSVKEPKSKLEKILIQTNSRFAALICGLLRTSNPILHSPAIFPSGRVGWLNRSDADLVHLHWVQGEMLSVTDIGKIKKPIVWTLHDMWAFSGAEHYTDDFRWKDGYFLSNRPDYESGFDLNRSTWLRKRKHWSSKIQIVTPSKWLAKCVNDSSLMRDWPVQVIPNTLDTSIWKPVDKNFARELLGLPKNVPIILFGAMNGMQNRLKGFDLLQSALNHLRGQIPSAQIVIFGQHPPKEPLDLGFPIHYTGHLFDDISLSAVYSAADVMVVPSRMEAFGQTASESMSCGTPVVAFDTSGLIDIISHKRTGYLAQTFDTEDLAHGILWVLSDESRLNDLKINSRLRAIELFSYPIVAAQYQSVYQKALIK